MPKDNPKAFHKFIVFAANRLGLFSTPDTASSLTLRQALGKSYRRVQDKLSERDSFTLIELLIVIAIIGILAAVVVLVVNPAQLIAQGRDSTRVQDLSDINTALGEYLANGNTSLGLANTVYVSVPDASATCSDLGLPSLPAGWSYHCVPTSTLTEVNGSGWIPVNFASVTTGNPLPTLPIEIPKTPHRQTSSTPTPQTVPPTSLPPTSNQLSTRPMPRRTAGRILQPMKSAATWRLPLFCTG